MVSLVSNTLRLAAASTAKAILSGQNECLEYYKLGLKEYVGDNWSETWRTIAHVHDTLTQLERGLIALLTEYGVTSQTANIYVRTARRVVLFNQEFRLSRYGSRQDAQAVADKMDQGMSYTDAVKAIIAQKRAGMGGGEKAFVFRGRKVDEETSRYYADFIRAAAAWLQDQGVSVKISESALVLG